jgi:hypothetical protein
MVLMVMVIAFGLVIMGTAVADTDFINTDVDIIVEEVAEIGITDMLEELTMDPPGVAGDLPESSDEAYTYLQYTSVVFAGSSRNITIGLLDQIPAGIELHVMVGSPAGGSGDTGISNPSNNLVFTHDNDDDTLDLVTSIGSCYTDTDDSDGVELTFWIEIDAEDIALLIAGDYPTTLQFTLTDESS